MKNQRNKSLIILTLNQEVGPVEDKMLIRIRKRLKMKIELNIQQVRMMTKVCLDRKISKVLIMQMNTMQRVQHFSSISLLTIFLAEIAKRKSFITMLWKESPTKVLAPLFTFQECQVQVKLLPLWK